MAVISKAISNVCLYGNPDIRCRLDYEVGIAHLILHQYPRAHLYSGLHTCSSIRNSRGLAWHPDAQRGRLFRNNSVRPSPLFRRTPKAKRAKCNLTPSWLFVSVSLFLLARARNARNATRRRTTATWLRRGPPPNDNSRGRTPFNRY